MIPDDDEAETVEDDAANLEAVLEPEEGEGEEEAGEGEEEAAPADEAPAEEAEDAEGNLLWLGIKLFKSKIHTKFWIFIILSLCAIRWS